MADAKTVSPLLDDFSLGSPFSSHNGIICCPAIHAVTKEKIHSKAGLCSGVSDPGERHATHRRLCRPDCRPELLRRCDPRSGGGNPPVGAAGSDPGLCPFYSHQATPQSKWGGRYGPVGPQSIPDYPVCLRPAQRHDPSERREPGHRFVRRPDPAGRPGIFIKI